MNIFSDTCIGFLVGMLLGILCIFIGWLYDRSSSRNSIENILKNELFTLTSKGFVGETYIEEYRLDGKRLIIFVR